MFDTLTTEQLSDLHTKLSLEHDALHNRLMDETGKPLLSVFGSEWAMIRAKADEVFEAAEAAYEELIRRERADA